MDNYFDENRRWLPVVSFSLALLIVSLLILGNFSTHVQGVTGRSLTGALSLFIERSALSVIIESPRNITYNFNPSDNFFIDLNVSSPDDVSSWAYTLEDLRHNLVINSSVSFSPNVTIRAVRWGNRLTVYANDSSGFSGVSSVVFYVNVSNTAPLIQNLSSIVLACEGQALSEHFRVVDPDEDDIIVSLDDLDPFYTNPYVSFGATSFGVDIISALLGKADVGLYKRVVYAIDSAGLIDTKNVSISVIEINNMPSIQNLSGAYTLWTRGDYSNLYLSPTVSDVENGNIIGSSNFTHNLTFFSGTPFFSINKSGYANISANESLVGVHNISFCVTDKALATIHPNVSYCGNTGLNMTVCRNFSITVTDENRQPTIISHNPFNLSLRVYGDENLSFWAQAYDPDGTIPDMNWYLDNESVNSTIGLSESYFSHSFGCGISGNYTVSVIVSDGLLNDSISWNVSVLLVPCFVPETPPSSGGGGGGGGGASALCLPKWGCDDWADCQNTKGSLEAGILSGEDYRSLKGRCDRNTLTDENCGFQIRECVDLNGCNITYNKPEEISECYYTASPSCSDKIKNCHDGKCEFLVDCGGPCRPCATCSDKIQNQGERGVDCGGPCPRKCTPEEPFIKSDNLRMFLIVVNVLLLIIIIVIVIRIALKYVRRRLDE